MAADNTNYDPNYSQMIPPPSHQMGWECPKCRRIYAPFVQMCMFCPGVTFTTTSGPTGFGFTAY